MKVTNAAEAILLQHLIDTVLDTAVFKLYKNEVPLDPEAVLADFEEADFSGYDPAAGDLSTGNTWGPPALIGDGRHSTVGTPQIEWTHDGEGTGNVIHGWYLIDAAGNLLAYEPFTDGDGDPSPINMAAGGATIRLTPYFSLQSRDEVSEGEEEPEPPGELTLVSGTVYTVEDSEAIQLTFSGIAWEEGFEGVGGTGVFQGLTFKSGAEVLEFANEPPGGGHYYLPPGGSQPAFGLLSRRILASETITVDYTPGNISGLPETLGFELVNQSEFAGLTLVSAEIPSDGMSLILVFSGPADNHDGFVLEADGTGVMIDSVSGDGTDTLTFNFFGPVTMGQQCFLDYAPGNVTGLEAFTDFEVENNSTVP